MHFTSFVAIAALVAPVFSLVISEPAGSSLNTRELQRVAAARVALAKARAARTKRSNGVTSSPIVARSSLTKRQSQLPRSRCSIRANGAFPAPNRFCKKFYKSQGVTWSKAAKPGCYATTPGSDVADLCQIRCPGGYYTAETATTLTCTKNKAKCSQETCKSSPFGVTTCENGKCVLTCKTRGYALNPNDPTQCIDGPALAKIGCGPHLVKCADSYTGAYNASCANGRCTLECPRGYGAYHVGNSTGPLNCGPRY